MTAKTPDIKANQARTEREQRLKQQLKANLARRKAGRNPRAEPPKPES